jgi:hypothetical protein
MDLALPTTMFVNAEKMEPCLSTLWWERQLARLDSRRGGGPVDGAHD